MTRAPDVEGTRVTRGPAACACHGDTRSSLTAWVSTRLQDVRAMPATAHETTREGLRHERGTPR